MELEQILEPCKIHEAISKIMQCLLITQIAHEKRRELLTKEESQSIRKDAESGQYSLLQLSKKYQRSYNVIHNHAGPNPRFANGNAKT